MIELDHHPIPAADLRMLQDVIASWCEEHKVALHDDRAEAAKNEVFDFISTRGQWPRHPTRDDQNGLTSRLLWCPRVLVQQWIRLLEGIRQTCYFREQVFRFFDDLLVPGGFSPTGTFGG
jgi:phage host-nuclease inhibitor protein Gam